MDLYFPAEICLDHTCPLPLPKACADGIYSQHLIEHITRLQAAQLVRECARVLKPGGWLRLSTPDLAYYVREWQAQAVTGDGAAAADVLNDIMRLHDHLYIYDEAAVCDLFVQAGLTDVQRARPQESQCAHLAGLDSRLASAAGEIAQQDLVVEARRQIPCRAGSKTFQ